MRKRVVIVGAGFAGLATAHHLARRGVRRILVLEREEGPGMHASGRNAGLLRRSSHDAALVPLLCDGARAARRILSRVPGAYRRNGSLVLGGGIEGLHAGPRAGVRDAGEVVPGLEGRGLFDPGDAIVDPHALLAAYQGGARERGVEFAFGESVEGVDVRAGRVAAVRTDRRTVETDGLLVAAGAWAGEVAGLAGSEALEILPRRRHLFRGQLDGSGRPGWPFVWNEQEGVYFRPEGDGLLLSPCDEEPHPPRAPELDPGQRDLLAQKLDRAFGSLGEWSLGSGWSCLRTFVDDERFVIGPDPAVAGLFWVAALGGHGLTVSWAVGRLAARVFLGEADPGPFDPARYAKSPRTGVGR